jgi:RhoGEF domain/PH domain
VESLQLVTSTFLVPLRESQLLPAEAVRDIFNGFESILETNRMIYDGLTERLQEWDDTTTCIGDVFLRLLPFLKVYRVYTGTYSNALTRLQECQQRYPAFTSYVSEWQAADHQPSLPINAFLIMPVQRLPRYNLLLGDLIKNTTEDHPDRGDLERALTEMEKVAKLINESVRQAEARAKVLEVQNSFVNIGGVTLVVPHRVFVKEGVLTKVCRRTNKPRVFFLFSDCLIYAEESLTSTQATARYVLRKKIMLSNLRVKKLVDERHKHGFQVINDQKSFVVFANDDGERQAWMDAIQKVCDSTVVRTRTACPVILLDNLVFLVLRSVVAVPRVLCR